MKRILTIITLLTALFTMPAEGKIKLGLRGGVNLVRMSISNELLNADNKSGYYVGPAVKIGMPLGFDVDFAGLYDQKVIQAEFDPEWGLQNDEETLEVKKKDIVLQANLRKGFGFGDKASFFIFAGPQIAFNINGKNAFKIDTYREIEWKERELSFNIGAGIMLLNNIEVKANYNIICGKTGETTFTEIGEEIIPDAIKDAWNGNIRNNAWQLGLTIYF